MDLSTVCICRSSSLSQTQRKDKHLPMLPSKDRFPRVKQSRREPRRWQRRPSLVELRRGPVVDHGWPVAAICPVHRERAGPEYTRTHTETQTFHVPGTYDMAHMAGWTWACLSQCSQADGVEQSRASPILRSGRGGGRGELIEMGSHLDLRGWSCVIEHYSQDTSAAGKRAGVRRRDDGGENEMKNQTASPVRVGERRRRQHRANSRVASRRMC